MHTTTRPVVMALPELLRYLTPGETPDDPPSVLPVGTRRPRDDEFGTTPTEHELKARHEYQSLWVDDPRAGDIAQQAVAVTTTNLGALYLLDGRHEAAVDALDEAGGWFREVEGTNPTRTLFALLGQAVVMYNRAVLDLDAGHPAAAVGRRDRALQILNRVPQTARDDEYAFIRAALVALPV
jgi:hypothetical protein